MRMEALKAMLNKPGCKKANIELARQLLYGTKTNRTLQSPKPEQPVCHEPLGEIERAAQGTRRIGVRITSFRSTLLDPDNLCVKGLVDGLRYCRVIPDDRSQDIELAVTQIKCSKKEERTEIVISYP